MIRTLKFTLRRDPANSQAIGYYATQQNAAYNAAVDVLNREPNLPKRSGSKHPDAMNKRITSWRQANRGRLTRLTTSTRKAVNRLGKPTSGYSRTVPSDWNGSPKPSPKARNQSNGTSVPNAAHWRTEPARTVASA